MIITSVSKNTFKAFRRLAGVFGCFMLATSTAQGVLNMVVDPAARTITLSGSLTGTPPPLHSLSIMTFGDTGMIPPALAEINLASALASSPNTIAFTNLEIGNSDLFGDSLGLELAYLGSGGAEIEQTITVVPANATISYASVDSRFQNVLETFAAAGTTLYIENGTSTDSVFVTTVPEPGFYTLLAGLCCLALMMKRRFALWAEDSFEISICSEITNQSSRATEHITRAM